MQDELVGGPILVPNQLVLGSRPSLENTRFGGSVPNLDLSDPLEFSIGLKEAQCLDPSLRLALGVAHQVRNSLIIHLSGVDMRP